MIFQEYSIIEKEKYTIMVFQEYSIITGDQYYEFKLIF